MSGNWRQGSEIRKLAILTPVFAVFPYAIYVLERWLDFLPSEATWLEQGWTHGPWRWEIEGFTLFYPLIALALVTVFVVIRRNLRKWELRTTALGLVILIAQILLILLQAKTLFWLID